MHKPEKKRLSLHFEKYISIFTARSDCTSLRSQRCFEGSIVFTRITGILISLSLEIPCVCCGLRWTLQTPTAPRHFSTFFFFFVTHWPHSKKQSHVWKLLQIHISSSVFLSINSVSVSPYRSLSPLFFSTPSRFQVSVFLSFGC